MKGVFQGVFSCLVSAATAVLMNTPTFKQRMRMDFIFTFSRFRIDMLTKKKTYHPYPIRPPLSPFCCTDIFLSDNETQKGRQRGWEVVFFPPIIKLVSYAAKLPAS